MQSGGFHFDWISYNDSYEVKTTFESPFLLINLRISKTDFAVNSDRIKEITLPKNTAVFSPAGTELFETAQEQSSEAIVLHFSSSLLSELGDQGEGLPVVSEHRLDIVDPALGALGGEMRRALRTGAADGSPYLEHLAHAFALRHLGLLAEKVPSEPASAWLSAGAMSLIEQYVDDHLDQAVSLSDLARLINVPVSRLQSSFKGSFGKPLYQFILERRIDRAMSFLGTGDLPIADIAYACGFSSQQHMTNVFSAKLGVTPGRYRRERAS